MGDPQLSNGAVTDLMRGVDVPDPVFQILGFKKIAGQGGNERYRLNISDGIHCHTFAMLATQLNNMVPQGKLDMFSVIRCDKIVSNSVNDKRVLIILELTVLKMGAAIGHKLGDPIQWTEQNAAIAGSVSRQQVNGNSAAGGLSAQRSAFYGGSRPAQEANGGPQAKAPRMGAPAAAPSAGGGGGGGGFHGGSAANNPAYGGTFTGNVMPIRDVTPYNNKCAIRARITKKTAVRNWSNAKGDGKLFSVDLLDDSGEVRMCGFTKAVDDFYNVLEENQIYYFKNFSVRSANRQFCNLAHDYEIQFVADTQVFPCLEDASDIPNITFNFIDIANIEAAENNSTIDVIGICKRIGEINKFTSRNTNKELTKRDIVLVDKTNKEIQLTLWGETAENFLDDDTQPVVACKGVKVSDFGGKSLSLMMNGSIKLNPDIREAHILRGWYDNEGNKMEAQSLSTGGRGGGSGGSVWKTLREASDASSFSGDLTKGDYFMSKVTIMSFKRDSVLYKACVGVDCKKKVIDNNNGMYRCEKCQKEYPEFKWRIMLQVDFADCTDHVWATCFQESGELILGNDSEFLGRLNAEEPEKFDALLKDVLFTSYICKFKSKMESFNGENRLKTTVVEAHPMKYGEYVKQLMAEIKEATGVSV